jgi:hypothetical protein
MLSLSRIGSATVIVMTLAVPVCLFVQDVRSELKLGNHRRRRGVIGMQIADDRFRLETVQAA